MFCVRVAGLRVESEVTVDFIERWLHVSPDGGNGGIELLYLVLSSAVVVAPVRFPRRGPRQHDPPPGPEPPGGGERCPARGEKVGPPPARARGPHPPPPHPPPA